MVLRCRLHSAFIRSKSLIARIAEFYIIDLWFISLSLGNMRSSTGGVPFALFKTQSFMIISPLESIIKKY